MIITVHNSTAAKHYLCKCKKYYSQFLPVETILAGSPGYRYQCIVLSSDSGQLKLSKSL